MDLKSLFLSAALALGAGAAVAGPLQAVDLAPITHADAALVVVGPDGAEVRYTPAELEQLPTYSLTTATPWREDPATFEGVLLRDVLAASGLDGGVAIVVTAENDYVTTLSGELLQSVDIMVATRVDGAPHSRRARGPIQFVIDQDAYRASDLTAESNFVWMAARIEPEV